MMAMNDTQLSDYVTFTTADQLFGLPIECVQDVFKLSRVTRVPLAGPDIAGVLNLRGRIVTAIELRSRLGLVARDEGQVPMAIGIELRGESFGLLVDGVGEDGGEHLHAIFHAAGGPGQVNDEDVARQARQTAGQHGGRDPGGHPGRPDRLRDSGHLPVYDLAGHFRGAVTRGQAGPAGRHDHAVPGGDTVPQGLLDRVAVRDDLAVHGAPGFGQQAGQHRAGLVLVHPGRGPVRDRDGVGPQNLDLVLYGP